MDGIQTALSGGAMPTTESIVRSGGESPQGVTEAVSDEILEAAAMTHMTGAASNATGWCTSYPNVCC
jgi:hypothetical protein